GRCRGALAQASAPSAAPSPRGKGRAVGLIDRSRGLARSRQKPSSSPKFSGARSPDAEAAPLLSISLATSGSGSRRRMIVLRRRYIYCEFIEGGTIFG